MNNQAEKYRYYYEAMDLIGCKHVSTPRQIKNGTREQIDEMTLCEIEEIIYQEDE